MTAKVFREGGPPPIVHAVTDDDGDFEIVDLPDGVYRLVAMSWPELDGTPRSPYEVNGTIVQLHGVAEKVLVPSPGAAHVELRPAGSAVASIDLDFGNDQTLIVIGTAPTRADPVLGLAGWSGDFTRHLIAANRMPDGATIFRGLPDGRLHIAVFAADNQPGFGAAAIQTRNDASIDVPMEIVASWSDARHDPPDRLAALTNELRALGPDRRLEIVREQIPQLEDPAGNGHPADLWAGIARVLDEFIELDGRRIHAADWLAADAYVRLQDRFQQRADADRDKPKRNDEVSYEDALRDLHAELGRRYPGFALKGIDWDAVGHELLPRAAEVETDDAFGTLVHGNGGTARGQPRSVARRRGGASAGAVAGV